MILTTSRTIYTTLLLVGFARNGMAQAPVSEAVCGSSFSWMSNEKNQSPCLVAAYLQGACGTGYWKIPALPIGNSYNGPNVNQTSACSCSSVVYNAVSACGACQTGSWITWPVWKQYCPAAMVSLGKFNMDIPAETSVPRWIYDQLPTAQIGSTFNATAAQAVAAQKLPDVTAASQGSTNGSTTSGDAKDKSGISIGIIIGAVLGGVGVILLVAFGTWFLIRRRRSTRASQAPSKQYINKWSKEVRPGQPPSRWGGTSYGGSVMGEPMREREEMLASMGTPPESMPFGIGTTGHSSFTSAQTTQTRGMTAPPPPSSYFPPTLSSSAQASQGHTRTPSNGKPKTPRPKFFGSTSSSSGITPYVLPALDPVRTTAIDTNQMFIPLAGPQSPYSQSADHSHGGYLRGAPSTAPSHVPPLALPTTVEYFGDKKARLASIQNAPVGRTSIAGSTSSLGRSTYFGADDQATQGGAATFGQSHSARQSFETSQPAPFTSSISPEPIEPGRVMYELPQTQPPVTGGHGSSSVSPPPSSYPHFQQGYPAIAVPLSPAPGYSSPQIPSPVSQNPHSRPLPMEPRWLLTSRNKDGLPSIGPNELGISTTSIPTSGNWTPHVDGAQASAEFNPYKQG